MLVECFIFVVVHLIITRPMSASPELHIQTRRVVPSSVVKSLDDDEPSNA
jgi:hypothetical protein